MVGTEGDPQNLQAQAARLFESGAEVYTSNAQAARRAATLAGLAVAEPTDNETGTTTRRRRAGRAASGDALAEPSVISVGASILAEALDQQAVAHTPVDWRPPVQGVAADLAAVMADPRREGRQ